MAPPASDLAYRTAVTAGPYVQSLAEDLAGVAELLRDGSVADALEAFEMATDRLQRFLTFLVVASELLVELRPALGVVLADYAGRLLATTAWIQDLLDEQDLGELVTALETGLAAKLAEYRVYDHEVRQALATRAAA